MTSIVFRPQYCSKPEIKYKKPFHSVYGMEAFPVNNRYKQPLHSIYGMEISPEIYDNFGCSDVERYAKRLKEEYPFMKTITYRDMLMTLKEDIRIVNDDIYVKPLQDEFKDKDSLKRYAISRIAKYLNSTDGDKDKAYVVLADGKTNTVIGEFKSETYKIPKGYNGIISYFGDTENSEYKAPALIKIMEGKFVEDTVLKNGKIMSHVIRVGEPHVTPEEGDRLIDEKIAKLYTKGSLAEKGYQKAVEILKSYEDYLGYKYYAWAPEKSICFYPENQ